MNEGVKITIEEWAGDNGISLSEDQIMELAEAVDISYEMSTPCGYGVDRYESENKQKIRRLENQIDLLLRYLDSKGLRCILHDDHISRMYYVGCGEMAYTQHEEFR